MNLTQIPAWNEIELLKEPVEKSPITVIGKGDKKRVLWVGVDLFIQTREYIENEREAVVIRWQKRMGSNYCAPKEIFLSTKTGLRLHKDSVSQRFAVAFRKAGVRGSLHRVRARFLTDLVQIALEAELEKLGSIPDAISLLLPIAEIAGHSNVANLTPYLAIGRKRLYRETVVERSAALKERAISSQRRVDVNLVKLRSSQAALDLVDAMCSGKKSKIVRALHLLCENQQIDVAQLLSRNVRQ